jgi:hypothetical protein
MPARFHRRLSDKILAAFEHADAAGEVEIAHLLQEALALTERRDRNGNRTASDRRRFSPAGECTKWAAFVTARNAYKAVCELNGSDDAAVERALGAMKQAYRQWSLS